MEHGRKRIHEIPAPLSTLPDGVMVVAAGSAFTLFAGDTYRWTTEGYAAAERLHHIDGLLTPPSTLRTLACGYRVVLHPSITAA